MVELIDCFSLRRPTAGVCELIAVMSGGQWCVLLLFSQEANGLVSVLS